MNEKQLELIKRILLENIMNSIPDVFPETYRKGYNDGVYAALQLLRNIDLLPKELQ